MNGLLSQRALLSFLGIEISFIYDNATQRKEGAVGK